MAAVMIASGAAVAVPIMRESSIPEGWAPVPLVYLWPFAAAGAAMCATGRVATILRLLTEPFLIIGSVIHWFVVAAGAFWTGEWLGLMWTLTSGLGFLLYAGSWLVEVIAKLADATRSLRRGRAA
jgi:hypothetical protein